MKTWITSDLHFGHKNIIKFCAETRARYGTDMDEGMIAEWNSQVDHNDITYILGDVSFLPSAKTVAILKQLNGRKILVEGNHDRKLMKCPVFRRCFEEVHQYLSIIYNSTRVVMFHYPIAEFDQMHRGAVHFHGHLHGNSSGLEHYRVRDVGCDATGKIVINMDDAIADAMRGQIKSHNHT